MSLGNAVTEAEIQKASRCVVDYFRDHPRDLNDGDWVYLKDVHLLLKHFGVAPEPQVRPAHKREEPLGASFGYLRRQIQDAAKAESIRLWLGKYGQPTPEQIKSSGALSGCGVAAQNQQTVLDLLYENWNHLMGSASTSARL